MADVDGLKAQLDENNAELRELRASWTERETRIEQLETQRIFYEEELSSIGHQYQAPFKHPVLSRHLTPFQRGFTSCQGHQHRLNPM